MMECQSKKSIPTLLVFIIGLFSLIPNTTSGQYVRMVILIVGFAIDFLLFKNTKIDLQVAKILALMFSSILLSSVAVYIVERQINQNLVVHEIVRISMNALIMILLYNRKIKYSYVYTISVINVICVFVVQIFQSVAPAATNLIIRTYYTKPDALAHHLDLALETNRGFFRAGAFLINPNICACAVALCSPYFYMGLKKEKYKKLSLIMIVISFMSIILSGSRTGLIVFSIIGVIYIFDRDMLNKKKFVIVCFMVIAVAFLMVIMSQDSISDYRSFNLDGALHESLFQKLEIFGDYLTHANPVYWLTGSVGGYSLNFQMDSEWGYIISYFGMLGLAWYISILKGIKNVNTHNYKFFTRQYQVIIILVGLTETVFLCMPIAPLFILVALTDTSEDLCE